MNDDRLPSVSKLQSYVEFDDARLLRRLNGSVQRNPHWIIENLKKSSFLPLQPILKLHKRWDRPIESPYFCCSRVRSHWRSARAGPLTIGPPLKPETQLQQNYCSVQFSKLALLAWNMLCILQQVPLANGR
jgi:hypothetical protein